MLSAFFGGLALLLAAVGLYGVVAHAVRARRTEIGLRMALGAAPFSIVRLVFQRVGVLIAAGLAFGLAGRLWAARFVEGLLFHLEPRDPVTVAGAAAVLVAVGAFSPPGCPPAAPPRSIRRRCCAKGRRCTREIRRRSLGDSSRGNSRMVRLANGSSRWLTVSMRTSGNARRNPAPLRLFHQLPHSSEFRVKRSLEPLCVASRIDEHHPTRITSPPVAALQPYDGQCPLRRGFASVSASQAVTSCQVSRWR
jgi:hypothetical protein